jgi:hypothetical protein
MKLTMTIIRFIAVPTMPFREGFGLTVFNFLEKVYTLPAQSSSTPIRKFGSLSDRSRGLLSFKLCHPYLEVLK